MLYVVGIDVASRKFDFQIITKENLGMGSGQLEMNRSGFEKLLECCPKEGAVFVMESTGRYHLALCSYLASQEREVLVANPLLVKRFVQARTLRKTKTDKADAESIAKYGLQNYEELCKEKKSVDEKLLSIARMRLDTSEEATRTVNQLRGHLAVAWPEISTAEVDTEAWLRFLSVFGCPGEVLVASQKDLEKPLLSQRGRQSALTAEGMVALAENSVGNDSYAFFVKNRAKKLIHVKEDLADLTQAMVMGARNLYPREMDILTSMPGIGEILAAQFLSEVGDFHNFSTYQKLIAFMGSDPSIYQSGEHNGKGHITKHGNAYLRRTAFLMANQSSKHNPVLKEYYNKKRSEGFDYRKAVVAVQNKMIKIIFTLLTKGELYKTDYEKEHEKN